MIKLLSKINKLYIIKDNTDKFNYIIIKISYLRKYTKTHTIKRQATNQKKICDFNTVDKAILHMVYVHIRMLLAYNEINKKSTYEDQNTVRKDEY